MRRLLALIVALAAVLPAMAQQPPRLEPIPEPPPPAVGLDDQALSERGIQIQPGERAEELIVDGKRVIRVTQSNGAVYYLMEDAPGYTSPPGIDPSDSRVRVPMWRVYQW